MKILLIDVNCKNSSTGKIVYDLYSNIRKDGNSAAICYGRGKKICEENIYKFGLDWETYLHALLARITGLNGCFSYFSTKKLIKYIKNFNPDVIHLHELHAYFVNIRPMIKYIKRKNIKVIWTFHCEYMYTGKCGYAYDCEKWKKECKSCPAVRDYPKSLFFDWTKYMFQMKQKLLKELDMEIVTPSSWLADRVYQSFLSIKKINVINNGIDTSIFFPRDNKITDNELGDLSNYERIVLSVAPDIMGERKGGKWILKLAEMMKNVVFILIGAKETQKVNQDNVRILEKISNQNILAQFYSMADVFLICSKRENFPTTCVEAICCGTPVVGFDTGGTAETAPNNLGIFVPYGELDSLKKAMEEMFRKEDIKKECYQYGKEKYTYNEMYKNYAKLYTKK